MHFGGVISDVKCLRYFAERLSLTRQPENLLLGDEKSSVIKVTDFGLSKIYSTSLVLHPHRPTLSFQVLK